MRVLLIEDDQAMCQALKTLFETESIVCDTATLGEDGLEIGRIYDYDLILLDIMLPDISGFDIARRFRSSRIETPIVVLTGLDSVDDKLKGFNLGVDDYLTKPFNAEELMARVHAVIRRSRGHADSVIKSGRLEINLRNREARAEGRVINLTPKEYAILELLALRKGSTLTKEMFLNHLYGGLNEPDLKIIDVFICKLRRKLSYALGDSHCIETVWGRGYILRDNEDDDDGKVEILPLVSDEESIDPTFIHRVSTHP